MENVLTEYFQSINEASVFFRDALPSVISHTYSEVCGIFTKEELIVILIAMQDVTVTPELAGTVLEQECMDYIRINMAQVTSLIKTHNFLFKIQKLTTFQSLYIELWAKRFWVQQEAPIQMYASTLLHKAIQM